MRINCNTYQHLGFLLAMKKRGYKIELREPVPGSVLRPYEEQSCVF